MIKKIAVVISFTVLLSGSGALYLKRAGAIAPAVGLLAGKIAPQTVHDPVHTTANTSSWLTNFANRTIDAAEKVLIAQLKQQILDQVVNQTIRWINGDGTPQFITDFEGFLQGAGDRAVGGLLQEINLGEMCQSFRLNVRLNLENTYFGTSPYGQQSACTLTRVVDNVDRFYRDFNSGGWIGYTELLRPQNNYAGALLMAQDEAIRRQSLAVGVAGQEAQAASGFLNPRRCLEWTGTDLLSGEIVGPRSVKAGFNYPDLNNGPDDEDGSIDWKCSKSTIVTPGQVLVGATNRAVNAGTDYAINADTFADYAAAIIDAGLNRLIREGVNGFMGIITDRSSPDYGSRYGDGAIDGDTGETGDELERRRREAETSLRSDLQRGASSLEKARASLVITSSSLITLLDTQISFQVWCNSSSPDGSGPNSAIHPETCANYTASSTAALAIEVGGIRAQINALIETIDGLIDSINEALNSPGGSGYAGLNAGRAANLVSQAGSAVSESTAMSSGIETRLLETQNSLNQCRTGTNPADCP